MSFLFVLIGCWLVSLIFLGLIIFGGGYVLVKRRPPDPPDHPSRHGLPYEEVTFESRYKAILHGWWIPAANAKGTVIFCHGQNGSMDADLPMAVPLHQAGYNVLMFNLRAHGTSEGKYVTFGVFEKEDLLGAIDFLNREKGIDKVAILGFSMGAGVTMIVAALSKRISTIILDGVFFRFRSTVHAALRQRLPNPIAHVLSQLFILGGTLLTNTRMYQVSPILWAKHLDPIPVLFIHSQHDHFVSLEEVQRLAADLKGEYAIWVAEGCQHREGFSKHPAVYMEQVLGWLERYA
jgi:fermentation-respiration switch protein FrsA (DUF1100 family)